MPEAYRPGKRNLGEILSLSSPTIEVATVQRDYSWDTREVKAFWDDLVSFSELYPGNAIEDREYFLGSIVLASKSSGDGYLLIDGQQRLSTATMLLSVVRDRLFEYDNNAATQTQTDYIVKIDYSKGKAPHFEKLYKFYPYKHDREYFRQLIQDRGEEPEPTPSLLSHQLIRKARVFLDAQFSKEKEKLDGGADFFEWIMRIRKVLTGHMSVVEAIAVSEEVAYDIFETLNDRGIGVSTEDLIRNFIVLRATGPGREEVETRMEEVWSLEPEIRVESFFRHFWLSHEGDLKSRSLTREIKSTFEKKR